MTQEAPVAQNLNAETRLHETWQRLESICRRLWECNSPTAVDLQVVIEEFKNESCRAEQLVTALRKLASELRETVTRGVEERVGEELRALKEQHRLATGRLAELEPAAIQKDQRIHDLVQELAAKESLNLEFHGRFLQSNAEQDGSRAKQMEAFYKDLLQRERDMESRWSARYAALEAEHKQRTAALKQRHDDLLAELQTRAARLEERLGKREAELESAEQHLQNEQGTWETQRLSEQHALAQRQKELDLEAAKLANDYKKKQEDIQLLKEAMQAELAEVVREYQSKMRGKGA
jgi:hypothetical protein